MIPPRKKRGKRTKKRKKNEKKRLLFFFNFSPFSPSFFSPSILPFLFFKKIERKKSEKRKF
jgi:hypothetical protein